MDKDLRDYTARTVVVNATTIAGEPFDFRGTVQRVGRSSVALANVTVKAGNGEPFTVDGVVVLPFDRVNWVQVV